MTLVQHGGIVLQEKGLEFMNALSLFFIHPPAHTNTLRHILYTCAEVLTLRARATRQIKRHTFNIQTRICSLVGSVFQCYVHLWRPWNTNIVCTGINLIDRSKCAWIPNYFCTVVLAIIHVYSGNILFTIFIAEICGHSYKAQNKGEHWRYHFIIKKHPSPLMMSLIIQVTKLSHLSWFTCQLIVDLLCIFASQTSHKSTREPHRGSWR